MTKPPRVRTSRGIQHGKLRRRISIQNRDAGQDAAGQPLTTWTEWVNVHARIVSAAGAETFRGMQFNPEITQVVTILWLDGVNPLQRIVTDQGQILDIINVNYGERRQDGVMITCKERLGQDGDVDVG